jgi:hypothetical protein
MPDALQVIKDGLTKFNLQGLAQQLYELQNTGVITDDMDIDTKLSFVQDTPEYKTRFAVNDKLIKAGQPPKKPTEILALEQGYRTVMVNNNLSTSLYDKPDDFEKLIIGATSPAELQRRVQKGYEDLRAADPEVVNQLKELYGVQEQQLLSYFLDPARTEGELMRQAEAARVSAQAKLQAGIQLDVAQAQALEASGATEATARQGFQQIREQQQLYTPLAGEQGAISQAEQIGAAFGTNAEAMQRVETRRRRRRAEFEAGGTFATTQTGISGLRTE